MLSESLQKLMSAIDLYLPKESIFEASFVKKDLGASSTSFRQLKFLQTTSR